MRVVLDTNTLVSGVIAADSPPRWLVDAAKAGAFELLTSPVLLAELLDVLGRQRFAARLAAARIEPTAFVDDLRKLATVVAPREAPRRVPTDPDDDHVLACALTGSAELIVSGDRDLRDLREVEGVPIVTAREAAQRLGLEPA